MTQVRPSPARARLGAALLVLCLGLVLASCGSSSSTHTNSAGQTSSQQPSASSSQEPTAPTGHMSPKARKVFEGFVKCMRAHGINYPALNLSGKGPAIEQTPLDRNSPKFKAARAACAVELAKGLKSLGLGKTEAQSS